jgi:hypothetical protein
LTLLIGKAKAVIDASRTATHVKSQKGSNNCSLSHKFLYHQL